MGPSLPLLDLREKRDAELETCALCPKLSRAACPVSNADGRETTTPWGKMSAAYLLSRGAVEATVSQAWPPWACTGCFACRESCDLKNDVAGTLLDARAALMKMGLAPEAATRVAREHGEKTAAADAGLQRAIERARARGASVDGAAGTKVLVGCLASREDEELAADGLVAVAALCGAVSPMFGCCGYPQRNAGDLEGFSASARAMVASLHGASTLVMVDAGCTHTLLRRYAEIGVELPAGLEVLHLSQLAARSVATLPALREADRPALLRYHDACALGRGLGIYDPPRTVLTRLLGRPPAEFDRRREGATCSGGGGVVPSTAKHGAEAIADARLLQHEELGGGAIATTCASSRKQLSRGGSKVFDLSTLLCRAFGR